MLEQEHLLSKQVGAKRASERSQKNLADKLKAQGLKLPLYPTPQIIERARNVMGSIDFDPTSDPVQQVLVDATSVPALEMNPLTEHWHGNVFVAPKGAVKNTRTWLNKTISSIVLYSVRVYRKSSVLLLPCLTTPSASHSNGSSS